jgi:hypothetical protein
MEGLKLMEGKRVYVELNSGRKYSGKVKIVDEKISMVCIVDKFGDLVWFAVSEINVFQEERNGN